MTWGMDTAAINNTAEESINKIGADSLAVYCYLMEQWPAKPAKDNPLFQFVFRSFYRLDNAGLKPDLKLRYFVLLDETRECTPDLYYICNELKKFTNYKEQETLQFSFATKLANTVDPTLPIYDSEVAKMYGFNPPQSSMLFDDRMKKYLEFYEYLKADYAKILKADLLRPAFIQFDEKYLKYASKIGPNKKPDFIVWAAGKTFAKKAAQAAKMTHG